MNVIGRSNMLITLLKSKLIIDNYLSFESFPCGFLCSWKSSQISIVQHASFLFDICHQEKQNASAICLLLQI